MERGCGLLTSLFLSAGFHPALRSLTDDPPALSEPLRHVLRRWGLGWPPNMGWTVWDHQSPETTEEGRGSHLVFFLFFFFSWVFICIFFQNKTEPLCLIAPDTDCAYESELMFVSQSTLTGFIGPFLNFLTFGGGSAKWLRQFYIIISSSTSSLDFALKQTTYKFTVFTSEQLRRGESETAPLFRWTLYQTMIHFFSWGTSPPWTRTDQ